VQAAQQASSASTVSGTTAQTKSKLTYFEAALAVLAQSNEPMSTREILNEILRQQLVSASGRTPLATLTATLYRHANAGDRLMRLSEPGTTRARYDTVRWRVMPAPNDQG
jgi:hypothetical protein